MDATIVGTSLMAAADAAPTLRLEARAAEDLLAISGGFDVALALLGNWQSISSGALSVAASTALNSLSGGVRARIDSASTLQVADLELLAHDGSRSGAYALAGALSASSSRLSSTCGAALVGAAGSNRLARTVQALIGDPDAGQPGSGRVSVGRLSLEAERTSRSRLVADVAGAAISANVGGTGTPWAASFAGGIALNHLSGGIRSGVHGLADLQVAGATSLRARARDSDTTGLDGGSVVSFAGGFAVSLAPGSAPAGATGVAVGLVSSRNTVNDAVIAAISGIAAGQPQVRLGSLTLESESRRRIRAEATGDALSLAGGGEQNTAIAIGAVDAGNSADGDTRADVDLGEGVALDLSGPLQQSAVDTTHFSAYGLAVGVALAGEGTSWALSGGGVSGSNTLTGQVRSLLRARRITTTAADGTSAATQLTARQGRSITATSAAGALALSRGRTSSSSSTSVSLGVAVLDNTIQATGGDDASRPLVEASLLSDGVSSHGSIALSADLDQDLEATAAAATLAIALNTDDANGPTTAVAGGAAAASNRLRGSALSRLEVLDPSAAERTVTVGGFLRLGSTANDRVASDVASGSLAAAYAGNEVSSTTSPSIGAAIAANTIRSDSTALVGGYTQLASTGALTLSASHERTIRSTATAVAIGAAIQGAFQAGLAGGGASSTNTISGDCLADLRLDTAEVEGQLQLAANADDDVDALVLAIAGAGSGSASGSGGSLSIGAGLASNTLGADGNSNRVRSAITGTAAGTGIQRLVVGGSLQLSADADADLHADVGATAAALAWTPGGGATASGAGSSALNSVDADTEAVIQGAGASSLLQVAGATSLTAHHETDVIGTAWGASLAAALTGSQPLSVTPTVGVSLADATINRRTLASLSDFGHEARLSGALTVDAVNDGTITSRSVAAALAVAASPSPSVGLAGGGAHSFNTILGTTEARLNTLTLTGAADSPADGDVTVTARDDGDVDARVEAITTSLSFGGSTIGAAAAIGVALARNTIGDSKGSNDNWIAAEVLNTSLRRHGGVVVAAQNTMALTSDVAACAAALGVGGGSAGGVALAGGGSEATNRSHLSVVAVVDGGAGQSRGLSLSGPLVITADDAPLAVASSLGAAVGASLSGQATGSAAIGVSLAHNTLHNTVQARLANLVGDGAIGGLTVSAGKSRRSNDGANLQALGTAVALAGSFNSPGVALAGGGGEAVNTAQGATTASIEDVTLSSSGAINLSANNEQTARAGMGAGVLSGANSGGVLAIGAVRVQNLLGTASSDPADDDRAAVAATVSGSSLRTTTSGADLSITSSTRASYDAQALPVSVAVAYGVFAGAYSGAFNDSRIALALASGVSRSTLISAGSLRVQASNRTTVAKASTDAGSVAANVAPVATAVALGMADNRNRLDSTCSAWIDDGASGGAPPAVGQRVVILAAGDLRVDASDLETAVEESTAHTVSVNLGVPGAAGGGAGITNTIANATSTTISGAVDLLAGSLGDARVTGGVVVPAGDDSAPAAQTNRYTLEGQFNADDTISLTLSQGSTTLALSHRVSQLGRAAIVAALVELINRSAGPAYTARVWASDPEAFEITASAANLGYATTIEVVTRPQQAASLWIGSTEADTRLDARILNATASSGGAALGVGVVSNTIASRLRTETLATTAADGRRSSPTLTAGAQVVITSSGQRQVLATRAIAVSAAAAAAGSANSAIASDTSSSHTRLLAGSVYAPLGSVTITSAGVHALDSSSDGAAVGGVAGVGLMQAESTLGEQGGDPDIWTHIGDGVHIQARDVVLDSTAQDQVFSDATSAAGGMTLGAAGALANVTSRHEALTSLGEGALIEASGSIRLGSSLDQTDEDGDGGGLDARAEGIAVSGTYAGGGAYTETTIASSARVELGGSRIVAPVIELVAGNSLAKQRFSEGTGGTGSGAANTKVVVAGPYGAAGSASTTTISDAFAAFINLGSGAQVQATGNQAAPGLLSLHTRTSVVAIDDVSLDAVSALAAVAGSSTVTHKGQAAITAATGSQIVNNSGDVVITSQADALISASSSALSGALGFGTSLATATNTPRQTITLEGASLRGRTIRLWTGLDGAGVPNGLTTTADSRINAMVVGIVVPEAEATTDDTNSITIGPGSELLARNNLELKAQGNWIKAGGGERSLAAATAYILAATPIDGKEKSPDRTGNSLTIDPSARLVGGSQHQLKVITLPYSASLKEQNTFLNLPQGQALATPLVPGQELTDDQLEALGLDGTLPYITVLLPPPAELSEQQSADLSDAIAAVLPVSLWNDPSQRPTLAVVNVGSDLAAEDARLSALIADHDTNTSDRARYLSQQEDVRRQADQLGLLDPDTGMIQDGLDGLAIQLPALYAAPGSVFLDAPDGGTITYDATSIKATSTASIEVSNTAPTLLDGADMVIDDAEVVDTSSGVYTVFRPGGLYVNRQGGSQPGTVASAASSITVNQAPNSSVTLAGAPAQPPPPDLRLSGSVINETGSITIVSSAAVLVSGELRGETVTVQAGGNFSLSSDTWFHTGADPRQYLDDNLYRSQAFSGSANPATASTTTVAEAAEQKAGTIFSRGDISISALYININGLIQSGTPQLSLEIDEHFSPQTSSALVDAAGDPIPGLTLASVNGVPVTLAGSVDTTTRTIHLHDITSGGGSINLTGQILSTGAGRVVAFDGQPTLSITNHSSWALSTGAINLKPVKGRISLTDTPQISLVPTRVGLTAEPAANTIGFTNPHGLVTGDLLSYQASASLNGDGVLVSSSPIEGLRIGAVYRVEVVDARTLRLLAQVEEEGDLPVVITAWDRERASAFMLATVRRTVYRRTANGQISTERSSLVGDDTVYTILETTSETVEPTEGLGGSLISTTYTPTAGLTYTWSEGQSKTITSVYYDATDKFKFIKTFKIDEDSWDSVNEQATDGQPLLEGQALQPSLMAGLVDGTAYSVTYQQVDQGEAQTTTRQWSTGGGWLRKKTYHTQQTVIQGVKDYYTHALRADQPITISLLTPSAAAPMPAGSLSVTPAGAVTTPAGPDDASAITLATTSGGADLTVRGLQVRDGAVPLSLSSAGHLDLQVGGATADSGAITLQASAAGDLAVQTFSTN
ncbi:MAG: beta strand repeat-containing protein, partial [Prochlorococcaceae cyanobacterium]